jgi:hypothetical protein
MFVRACVLDEQIGNTSYQNSSQANRSFLLLRKVFVHVSYVYNLYMAINE